MKMYRTYYWQGRGLTEEQLNHEQLNSRKNDIYKNNMAARLGYNLLRIWEDELDTLNTKIENIC